MSVIPKVHQSQNPDILTVESGGQIKVNDGGKITNAGTQASHIVDLANDANGTAIATAVNSILTALENVGILAKS